MGNGALFHALQAVSGRGNVINSGHAIEIHIADADWHLLIRRSDLASHSAFFDLHDKVLGASDIAVYLPNWRTLGWTQVPHHALARSESYSRDGQFEVYVQADVNSPRDHQQVISEFRQFMQNPADSKRRSAVSQQESASGDKTAGTPDPRVAREPG